MIASFSHIPWLAVLAAFTVYFVLGGLWFTTLFKAPYARTLGKSVDELNNSAPVFIAGPALCSLIITVATAWLFRWLGITGLGQALGFGLLVGTGFLVANTVNIAINPNIPHPLRYGAITGAYHLVGILLVVTLLVTLG